MSQISVIISNLNAPITCKQYLRYNTYYTSNNVNKTYTKLQQTNTDNRGYTNKTSETCKFYTDNYDKF